MQCCDLRGVVGADVEGFEARVEGMGAVVVTVRGGAMEGAVGSW
jgi:hypothetical protein